MAGDMPSFSLVKFKTLLRDTRGPADAINEVIDEQDELDAYVASCQDRQHPNHAVAFPQERAIAVALGARPRGGYNVEIIAVVQETGGFVGIQHHVLYVEHVPHGIATDAITYPQHVIRLRGLGGIVSFRQVPDWLGHSLYALPGVLHALPGAVNALPGAMNALPGAMNALPGAALMATAGTIPHLRDGSTDRVSARRRARSAARRDPR